ncbi:MAG: efflux RND transporter periplasmic adaptor subunit [Chloroflexales bacterium]|nr:efflux RND transporter periplasmic adaptor subunit [Chloroflexales bacterium]
MTTVPQSRSGGRRRLNIAATIAGVLVLALLATLGVRAFTGRVADPLASATVAPVTRGDLTLGVSATGQVEPRDQADLAFSAASGRVAEVLVAEGDAVKAGDALITLDSRQLAAARDGAAANLAATQADLQALRDGATPEQIAEAQAQVQAARGALTQTQGSVSQADLEAARAAVDEARARLATLEAGPKSDERTRATSALDEARAELDRQRSALASAKEQAGQTVEASANALRNAQSAYSTAYWDLEHVKLYGTDPRTGRSLNAPQRQDVQVAFDQAARALADAEAGLKQAQIDYDTAKQNEASGLQSAEARVRSAQTDLDSLLAGADADALAAARAQLARAQADLASLTGGERTGAVAAQSANLAAARARLDQLSADPAASDLARAEARVAQAQAQLNQAQIQLDDATLRAPFAGVVATLNVAPGESVGAQAPLVLIDVSRYLVKVTVDEVDIARVQQGQPVEVLIDALGESLAGTVVSLEPLPQSDSAVTAYQVTVEIDPAGKGLKPGMTASATIVADSRQGVLRVPAAAVRDESGQSVVGVVVTGESGKRSVEDRPVELGLRTADSVEIVSGLAEGDQVVVR